MLTKILIIVGGSVAIVVAMFIFGKMAEGNDDKSYKDSERKS